MRFVHVDAALWMLLCAKQNICICYMRPKAVLHKWWTRFNSRNCILCTRKCLLETTKVDLLTDLWLAFTVPQSTGTWLGYRAPIQFMQMRFTIGWYKNLSVSTVHRLVVWVSMQHFHRLHWFSTQKHFDNKFINCLIFDGNHNTCSVAHAFMPMCICMFNAGPTCCLLFVLLNMRRN